MAAKRTRIIGRIRYLAGASVPLIASTVSDHRDEEREKRNRYLSAAELELGAKLNQLAKSLRTKSQSKSSGSYLWLVRASGRVTPSEQTEAVSTSTSIIIIIIRFKAVEKLQHGLTRASNQINGFNRIEKTKTKTKKKSNSRLEQLTTPAMIPPALSFVRSVARSLRPGLPSRNTLSSCLGSLPVYSGCLL